LLDECPDYPKSSQINEKAFTNLYSHLASHYDSIISVHLSDKLSGTYGSGLKAAKTISSEFGRKISVINSKSLSGSLGLVVLRVAQAIEAGHSHDQIVAMTEKWIQDTRILVSVKTIKYLVRGGRLSAVSGFIAKLLKIAPIISVDDSGKAIVFDKSISPRGNLEKVMGHIRDLSDKKIIWNYVVLHANNEEAANWFSNKMEQLTSKKPLCEVNISPVIGANAGIGAAAVAFQFE
jgi:DegV family protein with EDD domain